MKTIRHSAICYYLPEAHMAGRCEPIPSATNPMNEFATTFLSHINL